MLNLDFENSLDLKNDGTAKLHSPLSTKTPISISTLLRDRLLAMKVEGPKDTLLSYEHTIWGLVNFFDCYKEQHPDYKTEVRAFAKKEVDRRMNLKAKEKRARLRKEREKEKV